MSVYIIQNSSDLTLKSMSFILFLNLKKRKKLFAILQKEPCSEFLDPCGLYKFTI